MFSEKRVWELVQTATLLGAAMMLVMLLVFSAPVSGQGPTKPPNENFGGNTTSQYHRSNESGKGNFGQCHRLGVIEHQYSRELNPSAVNVGDADCRAVENQYVTAVAVCGDPAESPPPGPREETGPPEECAEAEAQLGFP